MPVVGVYVCCWCWSEGIDDVRACMHVCVSWCGMGCDVCVCVGVEVFVCVAVGVGWYGVYGCHCAAVLWNVVHVECSSVWWGGVACVIRSDGDVWLVGVEVHGAVASNVWGGYGVWQLKCVGVVTWLVVRWCGCNVCDGLGGWLGCVSEICVMGIVPVTCVETHTNTHTKVRVCERVCVRGWYGWMM